MVMVNRESMLEQLPFVASHNHPTNIQYKKQRQRRRLPTTTTTAQSNIFRAWCGINKMIIIVILVLCCISSFAGFGFGVNAFSTGAGSCLGGGPAVGGAHFNRETTVSGTMVDNYGYTIKIDDKEILTSGFNDFSLNNDHKIELVPIDPAENSNKYFRGFLIRLSSKRDIFKCQDGTGLCPTDTVDALGTTDIDNVQTSVVCTGSTGVGGLTHTNREEKSSVSGILRVNEVDEESSGEQFNLDVTIVVENNYVLSEYYYSGYTLRALREGMEPPPLPTEPQPVPTSTPDPTPPPTNRPTPVTAPPTQEPTPSPTPPPTPLTTPSPTTEPTPPPTPTPTTEPTKDPTRKPTQQPTSSPVPDPTPPPTQNPTLSPTTLPPTVTPTLMPITTQPTTNEPTAPAIVPTTPYPTILPTTALPTIVAMPPTVSPTTPQPTVPKTDRPPITPGPTIGLGPTPMPTTDTNDTPIVVEAFSGLNMTLYGIARSMSEEDISLWERTTTEHMETFYDTQSYTTVGNVTTIIETTTHELIGEDVKLTYDQSIQYHDYSTIDNDGGRRYHRRRVQGTATATATTLVQAPFATEDRRNDYVNELKTSGEEVNNDIFVGLTGTSPVSTSSDDSETGGPPAGIEGPPTNNGDSWSTGAIVGVTLLCVAGILGIMLLVSGWYYWNGRNKRQERYHNANNSTIVPIQEDSVEGYDIQGGGLRDSQTELDDVIVKSIAKASNNDNNEYGGEGFEVGYDEGRSGNDDSGIDNQGFQGYGVSKLNTTFDSEQDGDQQQSSFTLAEQGGEVHNSQEVVDKIILSPTSTEKTETNDSFASMSDNPQSPQDSSSNRQPPFVLSKQPPQVLSTNRSSRKKEKYEHIHIMAPPGKLGIVLDKADDGSPIVFHVKETSILGDELKVGDKIVAVDDRDIRSLSAVKVSKIIAKKCDNPTRKLTVLRKKES